MVIEVLIIGYYNGYTVLMGLFDPPELKKKKYAKTRYILPKKFDRSYFYIFYWGSILMWILLFTIVGAVVILIALAIFNYHAGWKLWLLLEAFFAFLGLLFGNVMAAAVINLLLRQGVEAGDVTIETEEHGT
ncbi:MAG: hypothetical protein ACOYUZ_00100 [Patescibacteria group bacterium]